MQSVETLNDGLKRAYKITIAAKDIDARVDAEVKKIAPQVKMPGFRPGKVPANLVRKMHGDALQQEALNGTIQESVDKAIAENKLRPAVQPQVKLNEDYAPGKDVLLEMELEVLPEIETPEIEGLELERLTVEVDDDAVDAALEKLSEGQKSFETAAKSYKAAAGDQVIIDFEGKVDGIPFDGGKGESMAVEIGSGQLIPGFEDQLIGLKANDDTIINVTFPEDYNAENLKGKDATFDIVVGEVKKPVDTKIDDDMAKNFGLQDLEQLKGLLKTQVEQEMNGLTRTYMKRQLLDTLAADHDFEVPPSMAETEFNQIWQQLEQEAQREEDPEKAKAEMEKDREEYRDIAVRRVRLGLLLSDIGHAQGVEVSQQEMQMLITQAAQQYGPEDREKFTQYIQNTPLAAAQLRAPMFEDKVVDVLFEKAKVTDKTVTREALEAAIEADPVETKKAPKKKAAAKKDTGKKAAVDKGDSKKAAPKKAAAKKTNTKEDAKKAPAKKATAKKTAAKKAPAKKAVTKKAAAKK